MTSNHRALEESDVELIECIKLSPCLYDTRNPDFRLVNIKEYQWQKVGETLSMSTDECRKRWTILRDRYARDLKQLTLNPKNREFGKSEFFCRMDFLRSFVKKRRVRKKVGNLILKPELPIQVVKLDYTAHPSFETVEVQHQMDMRQTEESSQSQGESEVKYAYTQEKKQDTQMEEESHESQSYQDYVDDSYETVVMENQDTYSNTINDADSMNVKPPVSQVKSLSSDTEEKKPSRATEVSSAESEELFSKVIASYLKNLSRRYKIKAKVEMMQILEKYIDIEENERQT